MIIEMEGLSSS